MQKRQSPFDPKNRHASRIVRSLPRLPPFNVLRIFLLGFFAVVVSALALARYLTHPKPELFRAPAADPSYDWIDIDLSQTSSAVPASASTGRPPSSSESMGVRH